MELDPHIYYFIAVPDWRPEDATPLQGFSYSLCKNSWMIRAASTLPSMIYDLTEAGRETFLARRMGGVDPINWHGQSPRAIRSIPLPAFMPFVVLMLDESQTVSDYKAWIESCTVPPTIVAGDGGDLHYSDLTIEGLRSRFLRICDLIPESIAKEEVQSARTALEGWQPIPVRPLGYKVGGHATIVPNVLALQSAGYEDIVSGPFSDINRGNGPYIDQIVRTSRTILEERDRTGDREADRIFRRPPDVNLFAPAIYPHVREVSPSEDLGVHESKDFLTARTALERQTGYNFQFTGAQARAVLRIRGETDSAKPMTPHPILQLRAMELALGTDCMGSLAASEFSTVLRLPNDVNRTSGAVRQFAAHYRSANPTSRKRLLSFRQVKSRISQAVPKEIAELVRLSKSGVRIIADAHLEWLDLDGLPLFVRKNVSRIPVTPGNLFVEQVCATPHIWLRAESFRKVLVISALKRGDPISGIFQAAFDGFEDAWKDKVAVEFVEVSNEDEFVAALDSFDGPMVVFDGHGNHSVDEPAVLFLKDKPIDVWSLREKLARVPPIIILSACDTHAADRNHATTANGFLALGSRAVLGSVLPLEAVAAAIFAARMIYRIADFIPAAIGVFGRALTWMEVVSGMVRMQLLTDLLRLLAQRKLITFEIYRDVGTRGNFAINRNDENAFEQIVEMLVEHGVPRGEAQQTLEVAVAGSSAISYLHLGRPETILIDREDRLAQQLAREASAAS